MASRKTFEFSQATKADFIFLTLLLCAISWFFFSMTHGHFSKTSTTTKAPVYCRNQLVQIIDLTKDQLFSLPDKTMQIEVKKGKVRIARSNCPRQFCRHSGWISRSAETLICVPNQVVVEIKTDTPSYVDVVAY